MDEAVLRRERRRQKVDQFLLGTGIRASQLAPSTQQCLDGWARQFLLVQDQASANWANALLELCKAVECELACTLGRIPGLDFLADHGALGEKARRLRNVDQQAKQRLAARGIKVGILGDLQRELGKLATLRRAHGGVKLLSVTLSDAKQAEQLTTTILKRLHSLKVKP
jgi:hypothetical protein